MQLVDARDAEGDQKSIVAGDRVAALDLRHLFQRSSDHVVTTVLARCDANERGHSDADRARRDNGTIGGDHSGRFQLAHTLMDCLRRQPDQPGEFRVTGPTVGAKGVDQVAVHSIHERLLSAPENPIVDPGPVASTR